MSNVAFKTLAVTIALVAAACGGGPSESVNDTPSQSSADASTSTHGSDEGGDRSETEDESLCQSVAHLEMDQLFAPVELGEPEALSNGGCTFSFDNVDDLVGDEFPIPSSSLGLSIVPMSQNEFEVTRAEVENLESVEGLGQQAYRIGGGTTIGVLVDNSRAFTVTSQFESLLPLAESFETDLPSRQQVNEAIFRIGEAVASDLGG